MCWAEKPPSSTVLKRVKIFSTKAPDLNMDKRNSGRTTRVHKEKKNLFPWRRKVFYKTQYSKMTRSGYVARHRVRHWHRSFMQTDLAHTPSNMLNASDRRQEILKTQGYRTTKESSPRVICLQSPLFTSRYLIFSSVHLLGTWLQVSGQQTFSLKNQTINILGFSGHSVSVPATEPGDHSWEQPPQTTHKQRGVAMKLYGQRNLFYVNCICHELFFWSFVQLLKNVKIIPS